MANKAKPHGGARLREDPIIDNGYLFNGKLLSNGNI